MRPSRLNDKTGQGVRPIKFVSKTMLLLILAGNVYGKGLPVFQTESGPDQQYPFAPMCTARLSGKQICDATTKQVLMCHPDQGFDKWKSYGRDLHSLGKCDPKTGEKLPADR